MARKKMWVDYPDEGELSENRDRPGARSALVRGPNNKLMTHAALYDCEDEDEVEYAEDEYANKDGSSDIAEIVLGLLGLVGVGLAVGVSKWRRARAERLSSPNTKRLSTAADVVAARRVPAPPGWYDVGGGSLRWWDGQAWTEHVHVGNPRVGAPAGWYGDGSGRERWWDGQAWTQHVHVGNPRVGAPAGWYDDGSGRERWWDGHEWTQVWGTPASNEGFAPRLKGQGSLNTGPTTRPALRMSKAEWQEAVRAVVIAGSISGMQWRALSQARIEDADEEVLWWQAELQKFTPLQFAEQLEPLPAADATLRGQLGNGAQEGAGR